MDREVVEAKLDSLRHCVQRIRDKTPNSAQVLEGNDDIQDIISVNLERSVHQSVDFASHIIADSDEDAPTTMGSSFDGLRRIGIITEELAAQLKKAVGFRNIAVHAYQAGNGK